MSDAAFVLGILRRGDEVAVCASGNCILEPVVHGEPLEVAIARAGAEWAPWAKWRFVKSLPPQSADAVPVHIFVAQAEKHQTLAPVPGHEPRWVPILSVESDLVREVLEETVS